MLIGAAILITTILTSIAIDYKGEPYERIAFCEQRQLDEHVYFIDVADYKNVMKRSRKRWWKGLTGST
jgi:hypothetical protein